MRDKIQPSEMIKLPQSVRPERREPSFRYRLDTDRDRNAAHSAIGLANVVVF
jgi:hypothetical protein